MGTRSDVAIAMKECVVNHLSPEARNFLEDWGFEARAAYQPEHVDGDPDDAGTLFVTEGAQWYHLDADEIQAFYTHLEECHDEEDWLVVVACGEYPDYDEGNAGQWLDNPFNLHKRVTVELSWA